MWWVRCDVGEHVNLLNILHSHVDVMFVFRHLRVHVLMLELYILPAFGASKNQVFHHYKILHIFTHAPFALKRFNFFFPSAIQEKTQNEKETSARTKKIRFDCEWKVGGTLLFAAYCWLTDMWLLFSFFSLTFFETPMPMPMRMRIRMQNTWIFTKWWRQQMFVCADEHLDSILFVHIFAICYNG